MPCRPDRLVFGIGFHKTGTTSLATALGMLGYRTVHGAGPLRKILGHAELIVPDPDDPQWFEQ